MVWNLEKRMTMEDKKAKIIAAIEARGWFTMDIYFDVAKTLEDVGLIRRGERYATGGNRKPVWVAA